VKKQKDSIKKLQKDFNKIADELIDIIEKKDKENAKLKK
jgi:hypothetical protein